MRNGSPRNCKNLMGDGAPPAPALRCDHTKFLICSTPKLVPFFALLERNIEHRHRQPAAGRSRSTSVGPAPQRKSQVRQPSPPLLERGGGGKKRTMLATAFGDRTDRPCSHLQVAASFNTLCLRQRKPRPTFELSRVRRPLAGARRLERGVRRHVGGGSEDTCQRDAEHPL